MTPKLSGPVGVGLRNKTEDVYLVQWFLNNQGNSSPTHLAANGSFNPQTLKALQAFQKRNKLPPNGQVAVGSQTWNKLLALSTPPNWVRNRIKLGSANIQYSVGKNGKNHPEDVRKVQILLNKTGLSLKLKENGIADEKLYRAIYNFKKNRIGSWKNALTGNRSVREKNKARNELNVNVPKTMEEAIKEKWIRQKDSRNIFHRFGKGHENNVKYLSPDGHLEAIYYGKPDHRGITPLVSYGINVGTYNFRTTDFYHAVYDIAPYLIYDLAPYFIYDRIPSYLIERQ